MPLKTSFTDFEALQVDLKGWYDVHQRRLPWRARRLELANPYHVLLSEFMLQQTTVATVLDYFKRFIKRFPTIESLAKTNIDAVLHQWQGLGYYARARNLHKCAVILNAQGGAFSTSVKDLQLLPGVGPYTAAALAAILYDEPVLPIDGNVIRVLGRVFYIQGTKAHIQKTLTALDLKPNAAGAFAQALMDVGSQICTPQKPLCGECPLRMHCQAYACQDMERIPEKTTLQKQYQITNAYCEINAQGDIKLIQNNERALLSGLMQVPMDPWIQEVASPTEGSIFIKTIKHVFSHIHLSVHVYARLGAQQKEDFYSPEEYAQLALSTLTKKIIDVYFKYFLEK